MQTIIIAAVTAFVTSVICCNIAARVTFKIIDKYVADMIRLAKKSIEEAYGDKDYPPMPGCGGGAPDPNFSIPCPPKPKK